MAQALCHGAWLSIGNDGSGDLEHVYLYDSVSVAFAPEFTLKDLSDVRTRTVDTTFRIAEAASIAGPGFARATAMPRQYEPRNASPECE